MIDRDIKIFLLKALLAANGQPMTNDTLTAAIANAFSHVAMTSSDLRQYIAETEEQNLIAGTSDELLGIVWALTPKGKIRAQQLK